MFLLAGECGNIDIAIQILLLLLSKIHDECIAILVSWPQIEGSSFLCF